MATKEEMIQIVELEVEGALDLRRKVAAAMHTDAGLIFTNADTAAAFDQAAGFHEKRVKWATLVVASDSEVRKMFRAFVGISAASTQAAILGFSDGMIQAGVDSLVDQMASVL